MNSVGHIPEQEAGIASQTPSAMFHLPPSRPPHSCYSDRPPSLGTRLVGVGGIAIICIIILVSTAFVWRSPRLEPVMTPAISLFEVPAAPAEIEPLPADAPPEHPVEPVVPVQAAYEHAISLPEIIVAPVVRLSPVPAEPIPVETAPTLMPSPIPAKEAMDWEALVLAALNRVKRYPREASARRQEGVSWIRIVIDRSGKARSVRIERSSGIAALDREALAMVHRAQPLPPPPEERSGEAVELIVPVEFFLN